VSRAVTTRYIGGGDTVTYLRIYVRRLPRLQAAAVLAHELQDAVEVARAGVRSASAFDALFRGIGLPEAGPTPRVVSKLGG
jgi:hypothetical protein